ncbi:energy transducer TonB [Arundinibacter roseus]|uniref:Energy transducer TonB n=1 Tax=Arundinibacter roseus TaxID=2070510 RepID=A0A4R4KFN5_9BACT|nr:energy transducer TonB [Arundinibacter roseus]TDB66777.1 energy transducer TonB [Arundinibacter roseus]
MKRLNNQRIAELHRFLEKSGLSETLLPELLDHLSCEAEERMWDGESLEEVLDSIQQKVDSETLKRLNLERKNLLAIHDSLTDIVFENRNKSYGAYALRKDYGGHVQRATLIGVGIFLLIFMLPQLYARLNTDPSPDEIGFEVEFSPLTIKPESKPKPPVADQAAAPKNVKTIRFLPPLILSDGLVPEEQVPPTVEAIGQSQIGTETQDGEEVFTELRIPPAEIVQRPSVVEIAPEEEKELLFAEQQPEFLGGQEELVRYLQKNLTYPGRAARAGIEGKVFVEFTVGADGKVKNARTVKGIGFGCDEEAIRVIQRMPDWRPGRQAGRPVAVRFTMPITFYLD